MACPAPDFLCLVSMLSVALAYHMLLGGVSATLFLNGVKHMNKPICCNPHVSSDLTVPHARPGIEHEFAILESGIMQVLRLFVTMQSAFNQSASSQWLNLNIAE